MAKQDEAALAEALRENLRKRKEQARAGVQPSFGSDEEGDVPMPDDGDKAGAWVRIGSKKS